MPKQDRRRLFKRARRLGVRTYHFFRQMEKILGAADLAVCMGGYNTVCEILSQGTVSLVIPRETPRREQLIRAEAMHGRRLLDYLPWSRLEPGPLGDKIDNLLENPAPYREAIADFKLTGIDIMVQRIRLQRGCK